LAHEWSFVQRIAVLDHETRMVFTMEATSTMTT